MSAPARRVHRVLLAARGPLAAELVAAYEPHGIETVVTFDAHDAEDSHLDAASWACALPEGAESLSAVIGVAMDAGADAFDPSGTDFARDAGASRAVSAVGLVWLSAPAATLAAEVPVAERERAVVTVLLDASGKGHVIGDALTLQGVTCAPGRLDPGERATLYAAALAHARSAGCAGVVNVHFDRSELHGSAPVRSFGLPPHHLLLGGEAPSLAATAAALLAGEDVSVKPSGPSPTVRVEIRAMAEGVLEAELPGPFARPAGAEVRVGEILAVLHVGGPSPAAACVRAVAQLRALARLTCGIPTDIPTLADRLAPWCAASSGMRDTMAET